MKIITGLAKGMNLETLEGEATRPTSQRVKEAIFSMIQFDIEGACVLDLFAGSGQMGLEALSRGAKKATFCDSSREAIEIVMKNARKSKLFDKCRISTCTYEQMIKGISGKEQYDIIFIDPPYKMCCVDDVLEKLCNGNVIAKNAFVICESGEEDIFKGNELLKEKFVVQKQTRYSVSYVTVLRPKEA
ncbi:MAG: 16S rRNA (guanine(966)-N(2))-methyltransferase RsmD [Ruminococcaceae bacterium]|nr:16S rRNA (guanine(966)-N(2))-methyltransferase RsmD [Oscillospiraceae bacterium]